MFKIASDIEGKPLPKERQLEILIELLAAVQKEAVVLRGAVFYGGKITIEAVIPSTEKEEGK